MKEFLKSLLPMWSVWLDLPYKRILYILSCSFKLYLLILVPYFSIISTTLILLLLGTIQVNYYFNNLIDFTISYFYDGHLLCFIAWRVQITCFIVCVLINLNEE